MSASSLFQQPDEVVGITFMLRGEPGSGKTRFALGSKRAVGKPVAYVGSDRGAKFYKNDPDVGGFLQVETRDVKIMRAAIAELTGGAHINFGAVVIDTVTDLWEAEQSEYVGPKGNIPLRSWKPLRDGHERILRSLQALPLHVFLICEERPVFERVGEGDNVDLKEVGSKEDSDKKDSYVSDVRLRFFIRDKKFFCEVLKDRTGTFPMGKVIADPRPEMWISGPAKQASVPAKEGPSLEPVLTESLAAKMVERISAIKNAFESNAWRKKHSAEVNALPKALKETVVAAWKARHAELNATSPDSEDMPEEA